MELGVNLGYFGMGVDSDNVAVAQEADRLGYSVAWAAEAYGSDVPTVLAWVGARTERIGLGAAVMQIPARTPAMTVGARRERVTVERGLSWSVFRSAAGEDAGVRRRRAHGAATGDGLV